MCDYQKRLQPTLDTSCYNKIEEIWEATQGRNKSKLQIYILNKIVENYLFHSELARMTLQVCFPCCQIRFVELKLERFMVLLLPDTDNWCSHWLLWEQI